MDKKIKYEIVSELRNMALDWCVEVTSAHIAKLTPPPFPMPGVAQFY